MNHALDHAQQPRSVFVVWFVVPGYRIKVFENLSAYPDPQFTILAGDRDFDGLRAMGGKAIENIRYKPARVRMFRLGSLGFSWQPDAWRIVRQEKPDAVIVHGGFYDLTSWALLLWGRLRGVPVLSWTIGLQRPERGPKLWARRLFYSLARGLLVYGDYPTQLLRKAGKDEATMHVIYNSLDVSGQRRAEAMVTDEDANSLRRKLGIDPHSKVLIFIGRLVGRKRLAIALEALKMLVSSGEDIHLILIGDGDDMDNLKRLSSKLQIQSHVHFVGAIFDEPTIAVYMRVADAAIVPEAGLPIIHPMGYGVPPIISDNIYQHGTEWEAVEEGRTGYFYKDGDAHDLMAVIRRCMEKEDERIVIASNARVRIKERYSAEGHAERILAGVRKFCGASWSETPVASEKAETVAHPLEPN